MKICMIVGAYPPMKCGIGDYTNQLVNTLANNVKIDVITSSKSIPIIYDDLNKNINVYRIVDKWNFSSMKKIINIIKVNKPDIIHIQYPSNEYGKSFFVNILPMIVKIRFNIPVVETIHEYLCYSGKAKLRNLLNYKASSNLIIVEKRYEKSIREFFPILSKNLKITHIPISSSIPKSSLDERDLLTLKNKYSSEDELLLCYFGFINELKGFDTLIEAISKIISTGKKVKLLCIGDLCPENDAYHRYLASKINHYDINEYVKFTGFIESANEVADLISASQICVLPFKEGVSERNSSYLAAAAQGGVIVTTSHEKQGYDDQNNVYYIKPNDPYILANALIKIKEDKNFNRTNTQVVTWDEVSARTIDVYKKLTH